MVLKNVFVYIVVFVPFVFTWTIDLPEIRRQFFESNDMKKKHESFNNQDSLFYDNIDGNSRHNSKDEHQEYGNKHNMEDNIAIVAHDGGRYLEGLQRSIENFIGYIENCTRMNLTMSQNMTGNTTWAPQSEVPMPTALSDSVESARGLWASSCVQVTRASEHVRRLAELAMSTTQRLQDLAYVEMYQKDVSEEEDELIFKLASFLDRLARLTGFRPDPNKFLTDPPVSTTTAPSTEAPFLLNLVNAPEDVKNALMECLKKNVSSEPATVRCAYPLPISPDLSAILNLTNSSTPSSTEPPIQTSEPPQPPQPQAMELLVGSDSPIFALAESRRSAQKARSINPASPFLGSRPHSQRIHKRSLDTAHLIQHERSDKPDKRSIDENPAIHFMKYFVKHNLWENSNPSRNDLNSSPSGDFDIKNNLPVKYVQKRALFRRNSPNFRRPEHPLRYVKERIKETLGSRFFKNKEQIIKLKNALDSIRSITYKKSVTKANVHKRSIHYERKSQPRVTEDPLQDISYYVKNKQGTDVSPDLVQAAQVRLGLEQVFQTGNIEVVRRYGANFNPLVPAPFYAGVIRTMADM